MHLVFPERRVCSNPNQGSSLDFPRAISFLRISFCAWWTVVLIAWSLMEFTEKLSHLRAPICIKFGACRSQLKCDGTRAETRFRLSAKRTSPYKSAGSSVQSTTGSRGVRISGSNAGYTMFRGSVKGTGYPLHAPVSPSLPRSFVTVCHNISTGVYSTHCKVYRGVTREINRQIHNRP